MPLHYLTKGVSTGEDDMGEEVRRRENRPSTHSSPTSVEKNFAARSEIATVGQNRARSSKLVEKIMSEAPTASLQVGRIGCWLNASAVSRQMMGCLVLE